MKGDKQRHITLSVAAYRFVYTCT